MTLLHRYMMLTFWNKVAFWGSMASLLGLCVAVLTWFFAANASLHLETHGNQSPVISSVQGSVTTSYHKEPKP